MGLIYMKRTKKSILQEIAQLNLELDYHKNEVKDIKKEIIELIKQYRGMK